MDQKNYKAKNKYIYKVIRFIVIIILISICIIFSSQFDVENIRSQIKDLGIWGPLAIFILRFTSVIIPALPSTAYSLLSGSLFGLSTGVIVICFSDLLSCSICFFISRSYGKDIVRKLVGERFINRVENISQKHLENNYFLMTGFLMTGLFDFVSYAIGLTKTPWRKFMPALLISILLSNPPIVALGAGLLTGGKTLVVIALFCIFLLSIISNKIRKVIPNV